MLVLPSERTLRDYTHHTTVKPGFSAEVDKMLMDAAEISSCPERNKYVLLLVDEMHIKENLVYDKFSGELVGFSSLGSVNDAYEKSLNAVSFSSQICTCLHGARLVFKATVCLLPVSML